jgi:hypothetical protein
VAADFSPAALAAAAGVDPWALARKVTDGRPDDVINAGLAFRRAGEQAVEVARLGGVADRTTAAAYLTDRVGVWDAEASGRRSRGLPVPSKGTVEVWDLDGTGRSNITIRDFSRSGEEGRVAPETIDVNRVPGLPDLKRYHVEL